MRSAAVERVPEAAGAEAAARRASVVPSLAGLFSSRKSQLALGLQRSQRRFRSRSTARGKLLDKGQIYKPKVTAALLFDAQHTSNRDARVVGAGATGALQGVSPAGSGSVSSHVELR